MKIAILLPTRFDVGLLLRVRELTRVLANAYALAGSAVEVAVGLPERPEAEWRKYENFLRHEPPCKVVVRRLRWEEFPAENVRRMFLLQQLQVDLTGFKTVSIPRDWGWNFVDCDLWFNFGDPDQGAVLPLKPIATYVSDLAVRVVPEAYAHGLSDPYWDRQLDAFRMWRRTGVVLCSDDDTASDLIGYAGVRRESVLQVGSLAVGATHAPNTQLQRDRKQWVWLVEPSERHAVLAALEGLVLYGQEGGTIRPVIASQDTLAFERPTSVRSMAAISQQGIEMLESLPRQTISDYARLSRLLQRSGGLWSSEVAGGEGLAMSLAQSHRMRFLGQRTPLHERLTGEDNRSTILYASTDPVAIADALHEAERAMGADQDPAPAEDVDSECLKFQQYGFVIDRLREFASA